MSKKIPVGQVRLTNIAIVRYKHKGYRFELACFPNKVIDYRKGIEKDILNVLQADTIFKNINKGELAKRNEITEAFGPISHDEIVRSILLKGQLQVSEKERKQEHDNKLKEIIVTLSSMCINKQTKQPISTRVIENAVHSVGFQVNINQNTKIQSIKLFKLLQPILPIERVKMKIIITTPPSYSSIVKKLLLIQQQLSDSNTFSSSSSSSTSATTSDDKAMANSSTLHILSINQTLHHVEYTVIIDPGLLKDLTDQLSEKTQGQAELSVLDLQVEADDVYDMTTTTTTTDTPGGNTDDIIQQQHHTQQQDRLSKKKVQGAPGDMDEYIISMMAAQQTQNNNGGGDDDYDLSEGEDEYHDNSLPTPQKSLPQQQQQPRVVNPSRRPVQKPSMNKPSYNDNNNDGDDSDDDINAILANFGTSNGGSLVIREDDNNSNYKQSQTIIFTKPKIFDASNPEHDLGDGDDEEVDHNDCGDYEYDDDEYNDDAIYNNTTNNNTNNTLTTTTQTSTKQAEFMQYWDDDEELSMPLYTQDNEVLKMIIRQTEHSKVNTYDYEYVYE